ncbi:MAG: hypothetical protein A3I29_01625 [Candidatus Magasanikbacteria bacterium RIFCSPLOWO2_02_FULL_44_11]|uniref:Peptidase M16 n=1 Tax=Candidatus Magasanikbacteria bacterium RIFCSPLOWO2_02_FULL_44_11 TaxID=1798689 RepID=A0A1F6NA94_9BACT|nr:MAG: hypothetical protein A3I29_01625 [Candidatus Magasanikbacteria bacterium RIFCSPLOWO2_02_FULL_44_11]
MFHKSKLKNGITLLTVPVKGTRALTVLAMFPIGSRYETPKLSGAAHFVEHMLFKGTERRPTSQDITRAVDAVGADYNAFTYKDYTGYYIKIDASKQQLAFDLLSDMIFNSVFDKDEVEKEKGSIVEELRMYKDNPTMAIDIVSDKLVYDSNPLGWDIGGTEETVRNLTRDDLWDFYRKHYSSKNMVLVVAGNINHRELKKMTRYFADRESKSDVLQMSFYKTNYKTFVWSKEIVPMSHRVAADEREVDQAQILLNFPGLKNNHPARYALSVLTTILGGGMSSRLFTEVREKRGLAYMIRSGSSYFRDTGLCYVQAGLDPKRLGEAVKVIKDELHKITTEEVSAQELRDAVSSINGRLALHMEDSSSQAEWYAKQFFFNPRVRTPEQIMANLKKVSVEQVQKIARELLVWDQMRLAIVSPYSKEKVLSLLP